MAGLDNTVGLAVACVFAVAFWACAGYIAYRVWKRRAEIRERERRKRLRRESRRKRKALGEDDEGDYERGAYSDDDSWDSGSLYASPAAAREHETVVKSAMSSESFGALNLGMFNPSFDTEPDGGAIPDYEGVGPANATGKPSTIHRSIRNMSVKYERGKEIAQVVPTGPSLQPTPEEWRSSAYEDIENQDFVPPSNTAAPVAKQPDLDGDYLQATDAVQVVTKGKLSASMDLPARKGIESVCYEALEEDEIERQNQARMNQSIPGQANNLQALGDVAYENFDAEESSKPPPPPVDPDSEDPFNEQNATVVTAVAYENLGDSAKPPPPSSPPDPFNDPTAAVSTIAYENLGDTAMPPPPSTAPPDPFNDPTAAVSTIAYENLGDTAKPPPPPTDPMPPAAHLSLYENPDDYSEATLKKAREGSHKTVNGTHLSMYENPDSYTDATLKKARDAVAASQRADVDDSVHTGKADGLPPSVSTYQVAPGGLESGMSDVSMRSRVTTITARM